MVKIRKHTHYIPLLYGSKNIVGKRKTSKINQNKSKYYIFCLDENTNCALAKFYQREPILADWYMGKHKLHWTTTQLVYPDLLDISIMLPSMLVKSPIFQGLPSYLW